MGSEMKAVKDDSTDLRLSHVQLDQEVELVSIDLPDNQAEPLFERGFLPGCVFALFALLLAEIQS